MREEEGEGETEMVAAAEAGTGMGRCKYAILSGRKTTDSAFEADFWRRVGSGEGWEER